MSDAKRFQAISAAVIGLGSMGKRRIRCLRELGVRDIRAWDPRSDRRAEAERLYGIEPFADKNTLLDSRPDALVISTPPDLHTVYAIEAAKRGIGFFTEASAVDDYDRLMPVLAKRRNLVAAPSCCFRFHPLVSTMKNWLDARDIDGAIFLHHCGSFLPDWHPYEDYRGFYVAAEKTGAGTEMVAFELVWLCWLFGGVSSASAVIDRISSLEIKGPDLFMTLAEFGKGVTGTVLVDLVSRPPYRDLRVVHEDFTLEWNLRTESLRAFDPRRRKWGDLRPRLSARARRIGMYEWTYVLEIESFLDAIIGRRPFPYTFHEDREILSALEAARSSAKSGRRAKPRR